MNKTKLVKAEELKLGDHFIYEDEEYIRCSFCGGLEKTNGNENWESAYNIRENVVILIYNDKNVLKIL